MTFFSFFKIGTNGLSNMLAFALEPTLPAAGAADLDNLAAMLIGASNRLTGQLHPIVRESIGELVRSMNCYLQQSNRGTRHTPARHRARDGT
jgi:hypothetical protein